MNNFDSLPPSYISPRKVGLKTRLIRTMMLVGILPLLLAMVIAYFQGNKSLERVIGSNFKVLAIETSKKIDLLMEDEISKNIHIASHPTIIFSVKQHNSQTNQPSVANLNSDFSNKSEMWVNQDSEMNYIFEKPGGRILKKLLNSENNSIQATRAMFITDLNGLLISSINYHPDFVNAHKAYRKGAMKENKNFYISNLYQNPKDDEFVFQIVIPIKLPDEKPIGVLHRVYSAKEFFSSSIQPIVFGKTGHVMLINADGVVIDCPILPTGFQLENMELVAAVTKPKADWAETNGNGHDGSKEFSLIGFSPLEKTKVSTGQRWFTFAWQASEEIFAPTQQLFFWILAAAIFSIFLIVVMGYLASKRIIRPIQLLQNTASHIGQGQKVNPLDIRTGDEIENLANEINSMNEKLQLSFAGLEDEVVEKNKEVLYLHEYTDDILMSVPDILVIFDEQHNIEFVNHEFEDQTGVKSEEVIGKNLSEINMNFKPQWENLTNELEDFSLGVVAKETHFQDGRKIRCYEARDPLDPESALHAVELKNTFRLDEKFFNYQFFFVAAKIEKRKRIGLVMREITEEKTLQDQLTQAEKLSGLGTLAAGVAHEMNNPLNSIVGFSEQILDENISNSVKTLSHKILERSKQMASIIVNMTDYARSNAQDAFKEVDVNEILDSAIEIALMASHSNEVDMQKRYSSLSLMRAKPEEIQQIFVNIFRNAIQAMEGNGKIMVSSKLIGRNIVLIIQDNGPGIPQKYLNRIFDPFFTTKEQGMGTGLGLNIVHRLVEKYHGNIEVKSKEGKGTTFKVAFPIHL
ncbi:MAG: ATP-binding protein [Nitrospinales bacterium]